MMDVHDASLLLDRPEAGDGESAVSATRERFDTRATPALVLETARMDANIERMRLRLAMRDVLLRPHLKIKTAKSTEIARRVMKTGQRRERGIVGPLHADGACKLEIGGRVRILPNHGCVTSAQHDRYHVVRDGSRNIKAIWPRFGGW